MPREWSYSITTAGACVRTYIGLTLSHLNPARLNIDRIEDSKRIDQKSALAFIRSKVDASVWSPSWNLTDEQLQLLIKAARGLRKKGVTTSAATAIVRDLGIEDRKRTLAENTLMLLAQFQHGTLLDDTHFTSLIALSNGETSCWALITVSRETVDVRVRSEDRAALQRGTGKLLALLDVVDNQHRIRRQPGNSLVLRIRPGEVGHILMSHKDGTKVGEYRADVLGPGGRLLNALWQPLPRALLGAGVLLGVASAAFHGITIAGWPIAQDPWFPWWHDLADRIFTTVLWASAFATIQALQNVGPRWRTTRGGQVRISW